MKFLNAVILNLLFTVSLLGQGNITGTVKEAKTKDAAIGATVKIQNTIKAVSSDVDGKFTLSNLPEGSYNLVISYIGFSDNIFKEVKVQNGKTTSIDIFLEEDVKALEGVVVTTQRLSTTEVAVISELRKMQQIAVGISGQQIAKTQDRDASAVVRRVPGVSIFDDRFVVVRGLSERYNTVLLNDIITPSTEVDVKSFSFDLIPSSAIDRLLVFKSPSAELPGDMGGGTIKIFTKSVPEKNEISASFSIGYRSNASFQKALSHEGSSTDFLGVDFNHRMLPQDFPGRNTVIKTASSPATIEKFKSLNPYFSAQNENINPDFRANVGINRKWAFGARKLSTISNVNYSNTHQLNRVNQNRYNFIGQGVEELNDIANNNNIRLGVMSNWTFIVNQKNKFEFRNLFNQIGIKETVERTGAAIENNLALENKAFRWEQRTIASSQLGGTHEPTAKLKIKWTGGLGYTFRQEPDFRRYTSTRAVGSTTPFTINLQQFESPTLQQAARFYSEMDEVLGSLRVDFEQIIGKVNLDEENANTKLSYGTYSEIKDRAFTARWFGIVNPNRVNDEITSLSADKFFSTNNLAYNKVYYSEGTNFDDRYFAQNYLNAGYVNLFYPVSSKFKVNVGLRTEYNVQKLQSRERGSGKSISVNNPVFSPLPSALLTYNLSENKVIRASYGRTLNRPEFRELAPFTYYDFNFDVSRRGNQNLKNASIDNFDLRFDLYPSKTELFTVGVFHKSFLNPLEQAIFYNGSTVAFTVENAKSAVSSGVEFEFRKEINAQFTSLINLSLINSNVKVSGLDNNRYLQGQSPYIINTGIFYNNENKKLNASLLYNVIGKRIFVIGDNVISSNVFEMPRHVIDLSFSKSLNKNLELKLGVQDILNQAVRLIQDTDRDNKITDSDGTYQSFKRGSISNFSLQYKF